MSAYSPDATTYSLLSYILPSRQRWDLLENDSSESVGDYAFELVSDRSWQRGTEEAAHQNSGWWETVSATESSSSSAPSPMPVRPTLAPPPAQESLPSLAPASPADTPPAALTWTVTNPRLAPGFLRELGWDLCQAVAWASDVMMEEAADQPRLAWR